jgi:uncharacterized protein YceK
MIGLTLFALSLSGCGTICNLCHEKRVYGGVARDTELISQALSGAPAENEVDAPRTMLVLLALGAFDPVLSFIGDTLTLPITAQWQDQRLATDEKTRHAAVNAPATDVPIKNTWHIEALPDAPAAQDTKP